MAHFLAQFTHLSVTTCVIGDGAVSVGSQRDAQCREHTNSSNTYTIKTMCKAFGRHRKVEAVSAQITHHDSHANRDDRDASRDHTRADTLDDNSSGTSQASLGDLLSRLVGVRCVILRCLTDDDTGSKTRDNGERKAEPVFNTKQIEDDEGCNGNQHSRYIRTQSQ